MILMKLKKFTTLIITLALAMSLCALAKAEEGCATVIWGNTSVTYTSFADAWRKAVDTGSSSEVTFKLLKSWTADSSGSLGSGSGFRGGGLSYSGSKNLTLDLNGCAIDRNLLKPVSEGTVIYVGSTMTIIDSKSDEYTVSKLFKGGAIQNGSSTARAGGISVTGNATLNFNGGTILNCVSTDDGGGISVFGSGATLNVNGGSFYGNRTYDASGECCGGAIYSNSATVTVNNAVFEGNYAEDNGGAIYAYGGTLTVDNSSFYSNSSIEEGGAVCTDGSVTTKISNSLFSQNSSTDDDGGAIYCDSNSGTYLTNCQMYYNHSASEGGALHVNADKVFVIGGSYQYNTADDYGGGIYVDSLYDLNASGKLIVKDNTVNGKASDLCLQNGSASTAYLYCGGFYEGSSIWLCSTSSSSRLAIKSIDKYQYNNYIHFDEGFTLDKTTSTILSSENIRAIASVLGKGNTVYIVSGALLIIVLAIVIVIIVKKKKKKGAKKDD